MGSDEARRVTAYGPAPDPAADLLTVADVVTIWATTSAVALLIMIITNRLTAGCGDRRNG